MTTTLNHISLHDWHRNTTSLLQLVSDAPALEAAWLIEHVTRLTRTQQLQQASQTIAASDLHQLNSLRERRIRGEPLAYILGEAHFWTIKLKVSPAVLIPRTETELVVERALHHLSHDEMSLLDLGTGSGAIALAIASERPRCNVIACDVSAAALDIARENQQALKLSNVRLQLSNWFDAIGEQCFDIIVSNPPYIASDDPHVQPQVRSHEPQLALFAENEGFGALNTLVNQAPRYMKNNGWLILEHGWQQSEKVKEMLESQGYDSVASYPDLAGHLRVTEARFSSI